MFEPSDFNLPLEKELRLRVIDKEIEECNDRDALKENLKQCTRTLMRYQHLLSEMLRKQIMADLELFSPEVIKIVDEIISKSNDSKDQTTQD
tara:strand:- start:354 stop:629 length:276 start_codon:yes stop_codon:yes gene_type:complete